MHKPLPNAAPDWCDTDPESLSASAAQTRIADAITPLRETETVALRAALGRVVARDIATTVAVPNHTNSAMDGYGLHSQNRASAQLRLKILGDALAGKPFGGEVKKGQCVRITTGAVLPVGCDCVVIQERVTRTGDELILPAEVAENLRDGANVRQAGEDLAVGDVAIARGQRIAPAHLGLAASLGIVELPVMRRARVAFFSNGDELRGVGSGKLAEGELYDSNRYTLYGMLARLGVESLDFGVIPDAPTQIADALRSAAECADVVISSAGASVGEADYLRDALLQNGQLIFSKVAIKPGRPLTFGKLGDSLFFGLPGNPVSVMATFEIFVKPALRLLGGESEVTPLRFTAKTAAKLRKRAGRAEYQRGILQTVGSETVVQSTGEQGSGKLSSMGHANCFIILPTDCDGVAAGEWVEVQPFG